MEDHQLELEGMEEQEQDQEDQVLHRQEHQQEHQEHLGGRGLQVDQRNFLQKCLFGPINAVA